MSYSLFSFNHNLAIVSSFATSQSTSLPKHNRITLCSFSIGSSFSSSNIVVGRVSLPFNAFDNPYWTNKARILMDHKLKSFLSSNFSTINFVSHFRSNNLSFDINLLWKHYKKIKYCTLTHLDLLLQRICTFANF